MTIQSSGPISTSDVTTELGLGANYSASLSFLNGYMLNPQASPNLGQFYGLTYFQNNNQGNCNNGNCVNNNCPATNCTNCNCNCGNIQCRQCLPFGAFTSQCTNCSAVNCNNCQTQPYLQPNCNCSGGYACNCNATVGYNCGAAASASYNCNCACNCSKIICAKLYEFGMMDYRVWMADQQYGEWLKKHDRSVYKGYIRWAKIVTSWMDGNGPDYLIWIKNKELRAAEQKRTSTKWAQKIGTPWAEHMAYLMGALPNDNLKGRIIMTIGRPICKIVNMLPKRTNPGVFTTWTMWLLFFMSHYVSETFLKLSYLNKKIKSFKLFNVFQGTTK